MQFTYTIVKAEKTELLSSLITEMMGNEWKPTGGIFILQDVKEGRSPRIQLTFYQAMVKQ